MAFLVSNITQPEGSWTFNSVITHIMIYVSLVVLMAFCFDNVLIMDETEHKNNNQRYFEFKKEMFFVFSSTKSKTRILKKTFILECVGYLALIIVLFVFFFSFFLPENVASVLWLPCCFGIFAPYAVTTGLMKGKAIEKEITNRENAIRLPIKLTEKEKAFVIQFKQKSHPIVFSESETEDALFLETVDYDVCPLLLTVKVVNQNVYADISDGYRRFLENIDQTQFDAYTKKYFEDLQVLMDIFEKYYGKASR